MEEGLCSVCSKYIKIYIKKYNICSFCYSKQWREKHPRVSTKNPNKIPHWTGRKHSEESKLKISLAKKGTQAWNKGIKTDEATKKKLSQSHKGKKLTEEQKQKIGNALRGREGWSKGVKRGTSGMKGKKHSLETRLKLSNSRKGEKSHTWKGGITPINSKIRHSFEYNEWRKSVFERDDWTCIFCKKRGCKLNADHIKPFAYFPELRFELSNGRTLCIDCHKTTDTYGGKIRFKKYENI